MLIMILCGGHSMYLYIYIPRGAENVCKESQQMHQVVLPEKVVGCCLDQHKQYRSPGLLDDSSDSQQHKFSWATDAFETQCQWCCGTSGSSLRHGFAAIMRLNLRRFRVTVFVELWCWGTRGRRTKRKIVATHHRKNTPCTEHISLNRASALNRSIHIVHFTLLIHCHLPLKSDNQDEKHLKWQSNSPCHIST